MTPHFWQLFARQLTDLLFLPPLTRTWLGFRSGAIAGAWYWILKKTKALVVSTSSSVNPSHGDLVLSWVSTRANPNLDIIGVKFDSKLTFEDHACAWYCFSCLSETWYFEVGETYICGHLCVTSLLVCTCSPNPWVWVYEYEYSSGVGVSCWMSPSASWAGGVFGGQALSRSEFLVVVSSTLCCRA